MRNTFIETLLELAEEDPNLWLLNGDLGFSVLEPFMKKHADRYVNAGVAEQNMAGMAAGIALSGKTVFFYSIGNFPTLRCLEQIRNDICYHGADVKVVAVGAGYSYGSQGYTHHALEDVSALSALPGLEIFTPCDPAETREATRLIAKSGKPSYLRLARAGEPVLGKGPVGDVRKIRFLREGKGLLVLASGPVASIAIEAAEKLASQGIELAVASVSCMKPLDESFLKTVAAKAPLIITLEEHVRTGGLYAAVASVLAGEVNRPRILSMAAPEPAGKISTAGSREWQLDKVGLTSERLIALIQSANAS